MVAKVKVTVNSSILGVEWCKLVMDKAKL